MARSENGAYARALARGAGGALLFSFPLLMTLEMWNLGVTMAPERLLLMMLASLPMLLGLSYFAGFEATFRLTDEILDAFAALAIGLLLAAGMLALFGAVRPGATMEETVGKIALCAIPGAMGALLAGKQFGGEVMDAPRPREAAGYPGDLFIMMAGAVFLAFNVAPTEEVVLIAHQMDPVRSLVLAALSIGLLHVTVYELGFPGEDLRRGAGGPVRVFAVFTAPGYGIALTMSAYALWSFGRLDGVSLPEAAGMIVVLAFPAALGCATARLVV